ncbi:hypothetical protein D3C76_1561800 [compost metagenome]
MRIRRYCSGIRSGVCLAVVAAGASVSRQGCTACHRERSCQEKGCEFSHFHHAAPVLVVMFWITSFHSAYAKSIYCSVVKDAMIHT